MKIILSDSAGGAYLAVAEELKSNRGSGAHVVLVPDRFTASVERELLRTLELDSTTDIEVTSFTRLADKYIGKDIKKCLTPEGSVMLLSKVLKDRADELIYYKNAARTEGAAEELYAALTAIRNSGITSAALKEKADKMPAGLRRKAHDIALIYDGYLEALIKERSDSSTRLETLADHLKICPPLPECFYLIDFYGFKAPEMNIIRALSDKASSLTIGLVGGFDNPNRRIYPQNALRRLIKTAPARMIENKTITDPVKESISKYLFSCERPKHIADAKGKIKLLRAKNRSDEVLYAALKIEKKVREGARYRDFEILLSDLDEYASDIKSVFSRYNIPYFIDAKAPLAEQAKVRYILCALAAVRGGMKREDVLAFVKNPLFSYFTEGGADDAFTFENYVLKYNIDRAQFFKEFTLSDEKDGLNTAESVRKTLVSKLKALNLSGERPVTDFAAAVKVVLDDARDAWLSHIERLSEISAYYEKCAEQADEKIGSVLEEIETSYSGVTDLGGFEGVFYNMLKTLKIALVPVYLDCVFIGDTDSRFMDARDAFVLGAAYGKLPKGAQGGAVLTHKDEAILLNLGLEIYPDRVERNYAEMLAVCEFMKKPRETLYVSYAENSTDGAQRPASVITELAGMFAEDGKPLEISDIDFFGADKSKRALLFCTERAAYHEIMRGALSGAVKAAERGAYASAYVSLSEENKIKIDRLIKTPEYLLKPMDISNAGYTSVSRLERFFECPYQHYFKYILALKRRPEGKFEGTENGIVLHGILEKFFTDVMRGRVNEDNIEKLAYSYFDEVIEENNFGRLLCNPETGRLLLRLRQEGAEVCLDLYTIYLRSEFKPAMLEAEIGGDFIKPASIYSDGKFVRLRGKIDRVDVCGDKFIIIDYKTYKSADISLKSLYYGETLQLYIYLKAVLDSSLLRPAGAFYLPIFSGFTKTGENRYKLKGQLDDDRETVFKIDKLAMTEPENAVVPFKVGKGGALKPDVHIGEYGLGMLADYALRLAGEGVKEINKGYIRPLPMKGACDRCDFFDICGYKKLNERKRGRVSVESFAEDGRGTAYVECASDTEGEENGRE